MMSTFNTMDEVFDQIADQDLIDPDLLLLLRFYLGQRGASEICGMTVGRLQRELYFRTDDMIGDVSTVEAAKLLKNAINHVQRNSMNHVDRRASEVDDAYNELVADLTSFSGGIFDSAGAVTDCVVDQIEDIEVKSQRELMTLPTFQDYESVSGNIRSSDRNIGRAWTVSGCIEIRKALVQVARTTSGFIDLRDVILLTSCETTSGDITGNFYAAPGALISSVHGNITANIERLSWERLHKIAQANYMFM